MPTTFTCMAQVRDWAAFKAIYEGSLLDELRQAGARRFQVFRNTHDASQALILAELTHLDALRELQRALNAHIDGPCLGGRFDDQVWELTGWEEIGQA